MTKLVVVFLSDGWMPLNCMCVITIKDDIDSIGIKYEINSINLWSGCVWIITIYYDINYEEVLELYFEIIKGGICPSLKDT